MVGPIDSEISEVLNVNELLYISMTQKLNSDYMTLKAFTIHFLSVYPEELFKLFWDIPP